MDTSKVEKQGRIFLLAYDQGLEHGPADFNEWSADPANIIKTGLEGGATCIAFQYGIARRFYTPDLKDKLPLILKVNGKSNLNKKNYLGALTASVEDAVKLGAVGIGFTINPGQTDEHIAYDQFVHLRREAEKAGLFTAVWSYARGPEIENQFDPKVVAYAVRIAVELGADMVKVKYPGSAETFAYAVQNAAGAKVLASGTDNFQGDYIEAVAEMLESGAHGIAVGRKVWQDEKAVDVAKGLSKVLFG